MRWTCIPKKNKSGLIQILKYRVQTMDEWAHSRKLYGISRLGQNFDDFSTILILSVLNHTPISLSPIGCWMLSVTCEYRFVLTFIYYRPDVYIANRYYYIARRWRAQRAKITNRKCWKLLCISRNDLAAACSTKFNFEDRWREGVI